ncbi:unnamed protein product [Rotaria sp. Silwood2]|nr:unnamed protein product [Rotaria sp. Silwood2]CAF4682869.1 unnamed protein product [Rotaria sp. Silwood2]
MAKQMTVVVIILTILSHIHGPLHRKLINDLDGNQQRIWCLSQYSSAVTKYNTFITLFHFLVPFSTNSISALVHIIVAGVSRCKVESKQSFKQHLQLKSG